MAERESRFSTIGPTAFQYTSLYTRISEAKDLPKKEVTGVRDVFCDLRVDNEAIARTASVFNSSEPFWGEEYTLHVPLEYQHVSVYVYDHDNLGVKVPIGKVMLDRNQIMSSRRGIEQWFPLKPIIKDEEIQGELLVEVMLDEFSEEFHRGVVTLVEARDLASKDGKVDPYATIYYSGKELTTQILRKTRFPRWNKTYEIPIKRPIANPDNRTLRVSICNGDKFHQQKFLGEVVIDLAELMLGQRYKTWYRLQQQGGCAGGGGGKTKDSKKEKDLGSLRLKVQCHEERILDSTLYMSFVQLMLSAVEVPSSVGTPLLIMLEEVMTMDRNSLAHTLVRFYIAYKAVIPFMECLICREVENTVRPEDLFRGNSLASKCFDHFMKVAALPYLHETLKPLIDTIFSDKKVVELDEQQAKQLKSARSGSTSRVIESSVYHLSSYVKMATEAIFSSVERCPTILRQALKMVWKRVSTKFPMDDVPYIAVTGFIFLRFFVPAILSPKLFALREEHADQRTERTLKLTAKILQSIGNLRNEVEAKEQFLSPMLPVLQQGVVDVKKFISAIIDVEDSTVSNSRLSRAMSPGLLSPDPFSMGYLQHVVLMAGELWKRHTSVSTGVGSLLYRKRYFELTNIALTYYPTEKKTGEAKSFPVQWIKIVEKVDEGAFGRKHMFQVVIIPSGPSLMTTPTQTTLYLQASDVNEQNKWVSAIRKACLCNRDMSPVHHPGFYQPRRKEWTCCRASANAEPGCCPCHRGITIGDWRDPLDPLLDAQVIYSQYHVGKETLYKKYMPKENGEVNDQDGNSVNGGEGSEVGSREEPVEKEMEECCQELMTVLDELAYHHTQVQGI